VAEAAKTGETDYLEQLIDMIQTDEFAEQEQEKEMQKTAAPPSPNKPGTPSSSPAKPGLPSDDSIFNLLDEIMDTKQPRKSAGNTYIPLSLSLFLSLSLSLSLSLAVFNYIFFSRKIC